MIWLWAQLNELKIHRMLKHEFSNFLFKHLTWTNLLVRFLPSASYCDVFADENAAQEESESLQETSMFLELRFEIM